jgi:membrane fusion protein, multidrug efflux system
VAIPLTRKRGSPYLACIMKRLWLLCVVFAGCTNASPEGMVPPPPQVTVRQPVQRRLVDMAEATGRAEAPETYEVRVRVKGFLDAIHFTEGAAVGKGDLLYEIDPRTFKEDLEIAKAEVARLQAQLRQARSEADRAQRMQQTGAISTEEYIQKVATQDSTLAALRKADAAARSAELELSFTRIVSPIDGVISRTLVTRGNLVGYNEPTLLSTIVRTDPIYVWFDLPERLKLEYDLLVREKGATALNAKVPAYVGLVLDKDYPHAGYLDFYDNRVDQGTGTIRLRAVVDNKAAILTPGLFCRVKIPIGLPQDRFLVPEQALGLDQRGRYVLVVGADDTVEARTVATGMQTADGLVVIADGLKGDEWVIVNGLQRARPGAKVTAVRDGKVTR